MPDEKCIHCGHEFKYHRKKNDACPVGPIGGDWREPGYWHEDNKYTQAQAEVKDAG